jgi:hypothetical protein
MPDLAMSVGFDQLVFEGVALPDAPGKVVVHRGVNPPGNWFAPPGSNQSSSGGNETVWQGALSWDTSRTV